VFNSFKQQKKEKHLWLILVVYFDENNSALAG